MIAAADFLTPARARGFDFFTGVPCSFLTPLIDAVISDAQTRYVGATSEGEAVAIAAGAWLTGRRTVMMCQNSGLGNAVNPLTSLNHPFRIPTLLIVTWRGQPGLGDEPQHEVMGGITGDLLSVIGIAHRPFPKDAGAVEPALDAALAAMDATSLPFAFIMEKGTVRSASLDQAPVERPAPGRRVDMCCRRARVRRAAVLERFLAEIPETAAVIATTGKCGRELFALADRPQHLYQVGSMGGASAMGLGVAMNVTRPVIVLDGDGAALMKLGNMATIGANAPENYVHILLDNGVHDSTGGQATVSPVIDFAAIALACGYRQAFLCDDIAGFAKALAGALAEPGPALVHMAIAPGSLKNLPRPNIPPDQVARRFRHFLTTV